MCSIEVRRSHHSGDHLPGWDASFDSLHCDLRWKALRTKVRDREASRGRAKEMMCWFQNCSSFLLHGLLPPTHAKKTSIRAQRVTELKWHRWTQALFGVFLHGNMWSDSKQTYIHHIPKREATKRHYSQQVIQKPITWAQTSLTESIQRQWGVGESASILHSYRKLFLNVVEEENLWYPGE